MMGQIPQDAANLNGDGNVVAQSDTGEQHEEGEGESDASEQGEEENDEDGQQQHDFTAGDVGAFPGGYMPQN